MIDGIDWIASYPKSGNTWVRAFLAAYYFGGSSELFSLNRLSAVSVQDVNGAHFHQLTARPLDAMAPQEIMLYRPAALYNLLGNWEYVGKDRNPVVKTHCAHVNVTGIPAIPEFLSQNAIILVRDPRDVAVSFSRWLDKSYDETIKVMAEDGTVLGNPVRYMLQSWSSWYRGWQRVRMNAKIFRYEDILENPEREFTEMIQLLGWDLDKNLVRDCVELTRFEMLQRREKKEGLQENISSGKFFNIGKHGQYKVKLSPAQIRRIEQDHGDLMHEFGYLEAEDAVAS